MQEHFGIMILTLFIAIVIVRSFTLQSHGIAAVEFGKKDKKDFVLLPFAFFYLYLIIAHAFHFPTVPHQILFDQENIYWSGAVFCVLALVFFIWTMISFNTSFRVGLVDNSVQGLITTGAFSISRNPIYVSFAMMLIGQFLLYSSWILLIYIFMGIMTFHRQIRKEEQFLQQLYGKQFENYCRKVKRYL